MMLELIKKTRSYRRFDNLKKISDEIIGEILESARLAQSAANAQPLRYAAVVSDEKCAEIYPHLRWAGRLKDWDGPEAGERPAAYIAVFTDNDAPAAASPIVDSGISMQNMCLYAMSKGIGSCIIGNCMKKEISDILGIEEKYSLLWIVAFGYPVENVILTESEGDIAYYRDAEKNHYVPKRKISDIILKKF